MTDKTTKASQVKLEFITVEGKRVFVARLEDYKFQDFEVLLERAGKLIRNEPLGSVLCLTAVNNMTPILTNKELFADYLKKNKPYIKASALFGVAPLIMPIINAVDHFSGRSDIKVFKDEKEALNWLLSF